MNERPRVNVKVERGSTLTYTRDLLHSVSILFTSVRKENIPDSENILKADTSRLEKPIMWKQKKKKKEKKK